MARVEGLGMWKMVPLSRDAASLKAGKENGGKVLPPSDMTNVG
jgi:hypothetical protein